MLVIRLQRTGRSGISHFRVIVQEKRFSPVSGKILAFVGSYDPHSKQATLDTEAIKKYLADGAQPSDRLKKIFKAEKISIPGWVVPPLKRKKAPKTEPEAEKPAPKPEAPAEEGNQEEAKPEEVEKAEEASVPQEETAVAETAEVPAEGAEQVEQGAQEEQVEKTEEESKPQETEAVPTEETPPEEPAPIA